MLDTAGTARYFDGVEPRRRSSKDEVRYQALRQTLERAVARSCPAWLASRREDIVQAAMMRVVGRSRDGKSLDEMSSSYLFRVAYTSLVDEIRLQRRRRMEQTDSAHDTETPLPSAGPSPEQRAQSRQLGRAIKACLERLAQTRNIAVSLYLQGCNVPEISGRVGWSRKQAENAVYRGLADMRRCLSDKGVQP